MAQPILVYGMPGSDRYTLLKGPIHDWLIEQRITATWTPRLNGWCVRTDRLGDVLARAENDGYVVRMKGPVPG